MKTFQKITAWLFIFGAFLLPLKFGSLAMMPEQSSMFPSDWISWLVITYPPHFCGILGALILLLTVCAFPAPRFKSAAGAATLIWSFGFPLATLPGFVHASVFDWSLAAFAFWSGTGSFVLAGFWIFSAEPRWKKVFLSALAFSTLLVGIDAWRQYFWGFEEMQDLMRKQIEQGVNISVPMQIRMMDARVFASLGSCNTLAGFMLLTAPLAVVCFWEWGKKFEPRKVSQILFSVIALALTVAVLPLTRSRGAVLCLIITAVVWFFSSRFKRRYKIAAAVLGAVLVIAGGVLISRSSRGMLSINERFDYMRTSGILMKDFPLTGGGWGEFFHRHMKIKLTDSDESARDPHNLIVTFGAHCGIPAALLVGAGCLLLLWLLFRRTPEDFTARIARWGVLAFIFHCMMEINHSIPALMILLPLIVLSLAKQEHSGLPDSIRRRVLWSFAALILAASSFESNRRYLAAEYALSELEALMHQKELNSIQIMQAVNKADSLRVNSPVIVELGGDALCVIGQFDAARPLYETANQRDPQRPGTLRRLAELAWRRGEPDTAKALMRKAHELFPANKKYDENIFDKRE